MQLKYHTTNKAFLTAVFLLAILCCISSCKKFIEVEAPYTSMNGANVYTNDVTATAVLTNLYAQMSDDNGGSINNIGNLTNMVLIPGLSSDELVVFDLSNSKFLTDCYRNSLSSQVSLPAYWTNIYNYIFKINAAIEGLTDNRSLTSAVQQQLLGEAKFLRAFCYFHLINLYGDVCIVLTTDYKQTAAMPRSHSALVYAQVVKDLNDAQSLLSDQYKAGDVQIATNERVRPTKWSANALLARVYLYMSDYTNAALQATTLIDNSNLFNLTSLDSTFLKNSRETIWALPSVRNGKDASASEGSTFNLTSAGPTPVTNQNFYLSNYIFNSFENNDERKTHWTGIVSTSNGTYPYSFKYKLGQENISGETSEYRVMLRLGEQYLIRAEARTYLGDYDGAKGDLNTIRTRAGLENTIAASSQTEMLDAILQERKSELFTEGGHRWFDLKRWPNNTLAAVMTPVCEAKGGSWRNDWALYPLPASDIVANQKLVQNAGYTQ